MTVFLGKLSNILSNNLETTFIMARRKIREYDGKRIICQHLAQVSAENLSRGSAENSLRTNAEKTSPFFISPIFQSILVTPETDIELLHLPEHQKYVVKPDQLFGKRKQQGLVLLNASSEEVKRWITEHRNKPHTLGKVTDTLTHFLIEPQISHAQEYYLSFTSESDGDFIQFSCQGGAGIEERWETVKSVFIPTLENATEDYLGKIIEDIEEKNLYPFVQEVFKIFRQLHFCSLEINPFTITIDSFAINTEGNTKENTTGKTKRKIFLLDLVAEVDDCASFKNLWPELTFPHPFGRTVSAEEEHVRLLDQDSGASLKLTLLNPKAKVWNILSGGGASIICLDSLAAVGLGSEVANYGEYSGNPTTEESYQYAKTVLELMTKLPLKKITDFNTQISKIEQAPNSEKKILLIAGAIANFTDVEKTFIGIIQALEEYQEKLRENKTKIIVRRGGPNYEKGLQLIQEAGKRLKLPLEVYGPEMPLTEVTMRLKEMYVIGKSK